MAGQNAFLVHLCLFMCYQTISVFLVVLVVLVVVVLFVCCCCFVVVTVVALTLILFGSVCVCVVHGCVCLLTLRLASLSHFSYLQHSLFILGKVYIPLGF